MDLIADENLHVPSVAVLRAAGHDVLSIRESHPGMQDPDILKLAVDTKRILVTRDRDFGELVSLRRLPTPPAVVYVRLRGGHLEADGRAVVSLLLRNADGIVGNFVTLTAEGERFRTLTAP